MKPLKTHAEQHSAFQLFQSCLDQQLNPNHPLYQLADLIHWQRFNEAFAPLYCENNSAPALPTRLRSDSNTSSTPTIISDEELADRWLAK